MTKLQMGENTMLKVNRISKSFHGRQVLKEITFTVNSGEIYGLIGKNGAGKTTLMNIIAGLSCPDSGSCLIDNKNKRNSNSVRTGYLPDLPSFYEYLTAKEYMDFLLMNTRKQNLSDKRNQLLENVKLSGKEKIKDMSRGMKQRLGIAAALVNDPPILLLDEPTSALDPMGRHELMEILKSLKKEGKAILLSTHILADMEQVCDNTGFLNNGTIEKEINVNSLLLGNSDIWEITFKTLFPAALYANDIVKITHQNNTTFLFESTDQKALLHCLAGIQSEIINIHNKIQSLNDIFQEVCK